MAGAQDLLVETELPGELHPGESGTAAFAIRLDDPEGLIEEGVLFLNIVLDDRDRNYPQAAHWVFAGASADPNVFQRVYSGEELREGFEVVLEYTTRSRAPAGDYSLVVQLFRGSGTNPHRVRAEDRVDMVPFRFRMVAEN